MLNLGDQACGGEVLVEISAGSPGPAEAEDWALSLRTRKSCPFLLALRSWRSVGAGLLRLLERVAGGVA